MHAGQLRYHGSVIKKMRKEMTHKIEDCGHAATG